MLESLDGGKPIRESRDVDLPLAAAHFFYYAGWADKLEYAFPARKPKPIGVAGQIIPWNFPLLMLAWKIAPALAAGNTVVLKPAETTPLTALFFADVCRQAELPAGRRQHRHRRRPRRRRARQARRRRQDRLHRLDRRRQGDPARARGHRHEADARARRQGGEHHLRRRRARPGGRGDRQRDLLQPGPRLLRRLAPARAGVDLRGDRLEAEAPARDAAARRPARQEHRHRRDQLEDAAGQDHRARRVGQGGGRRDLPAALPAAGEGLLVRADRLHQRRAELPDRAGGDLRARPLRADVPHARGGGREGEQHRLRALGRASGRRRARASSGWRTS